jgi:hypothetical protein
MRKVGEEVRFYSYELEGFHDGTIVNMYSDGSLVIQIDDKTYLVEEKDVVAPIHYTFYDSHECTPYVGITHTENKCVRCGIWMPERSVQQYLTKKGI